MLRRMKKRFLDWPLAQKFVFVFSLMTLLSGALMVGALHLGLSVFEEKFYEKSLQELDFFLQRVDGDIQEVDTLTRSIAVDSAVQQQLGELAAADPETAAYYYLLTGVRPLLLEKLYQSRQLSSIQYTDLYGHTLTIGEEMPDPAPSMARRWRLCWSKRPAALPCCRRWTQITPTCSAGAPFCRARTSAWPRWAP